MKRVLLFSLVYYPRFIGGAEVAIKEITDRINPSDIEFHMVTLRLDKTLTRYEKIGNVHVHRIGFVGECKEPADSLKFPLKLNKYLLPFIGCAKAVALHRKYSFDATWAMMANYAGFAALFFKMLNPRTPFILSLQEGDPIDYIKKRVGLLYPLFKQIFTRANRIQTISHYLAGFARDMGYEGQIEVVPNAVDTKHFSRGYSDFELTDLKTKLGKKYTDVFLIHTGRLVVKNAVGDIIKSLRYLPETVKLLLVGQGYQEAELKALAESEGVGSRVQFLGFIPHSDMPRYLQVSDVFIRPSLSEGFGNSFIEAMASGIPVVATPVGGIVDFIKDGETGVFCKPEDPKSIAEAVLKITGNSALHKALVEKAKKMVFENYDWQKIARDMKERVFERVLL